MVLMDMSMTQIQMKNHHITMMMNRTMTMKVRKMTCSQEIIQTMKTRLNTMKMDMKMKEVMEVMKENHMNQILRLILMSQNTNLMTTRILNLKNFEYKFNLKSLKRKHNSIIEMII